jgi:U3 small nucleolar RNA-associated protein 18
MISAADPRCVLFLFCVVVQRLHNNAGSSVDRLPQGKLQMVRVRDANQAGVSSAVVQSVKFHPGASVVMTAGLDKTIRLFQADGKENALLQSVHIADLPIFSAHFTQGGDEIVMSGRRKFFYTYDLQEGKVRKIHEIQGRKEKSLENMFVSPDSKYLVFTGESGSLVMVSNKTKQWVNTLKMNGSARGVAFMDDGQKMLSSGSDGKVYVWDLRMNKCMHVFTDEGCVKSTALAASSNNEYVACGSDSGVVNIYDSTCLTKSNPKPVKAVMNLTTDIHNVEFHPKNQMLGISSRSKKEAFRMVHLPSYSVFANWPTAGTPLGYVNSFGFSPGGGYTAVGNDKGKVLLYRVSHYPDM